MRVLLSQPPPPAAAPQAGWTGTTSPRVC